MVHAAADQNLQRAVRIHIEQTRQHIRNLQRFFAELGQVPRRETNEAAKGLVGEAQEGIQEARSDALRDCVINAAVVKVEHFEIGSYRGLIPGARLMMGQSMVVDDLLREAARAEQPEGEGLLDKAKKLKDRL